MIRWLFIIAFMPLSWGEALEHTQENQPLPAQEQNLLILVDLQGAFSVQKLPARNLPLYKIKK
jgi:hypothetical protein